MNTRKNKKGNFGRKKTIRKQKGGTKWGTVKRYSPSRKMLGFKPKGATKGIRSEHLPSIHKQETHAQTTKYFL